jgi:hypothetical protein
MRLSLRRVPQEYRFNYEKTRAFDIGYNSLNQRPATARSASAIDAAGSPI